MTSAMIRSFRNILSTRHNVRAHFWQSLANYVQQGSGLILSVILARMLSPDIFGEFVLITSIVTLALLPVSWSLAPRIVSEFASNESIVNEAFLFAKRILPIRLLFLFVACYWIAINVGLHACIASVIIGIPVAFADFANIPKSILEGRHTYKANFYDSIITAIYAAAISVPLAHAGSGIWALVAPTLPLFMTQCLLFNRLAHYPVSSKFSTLDSSHFCSGLAIWLSSVSEVLLHRTDKLVLGIFGSAAALGDYNRAFNFTPVSSKLLLSLAGNPAVTQIANAAGRTRRISLMRNSSLLLVMAGLLNFAVWHWFSDPLVIILFGPHWISAIPVFEAFAAIGLVGPLAYLPVAFLLAAKEYRYLAGFRVVTTLAFFLIAFVLGPTMNGVLMAYLFQATLVAQAIFAWFRVCFLLLTEHVE